MAGATVTIACKLPHGLILRAFAMEDWSEPVMGGGMRTVKRAVQKGEPVRINGNAVPFGKTPDYAIVGGYALTHGVPADFWAEWLEQNKGSDIVAKGLIFAHEKQDHAAGRAKEQATLRSGLEPIDPSRLPKGIQTATEKAA